MSKSPSTRNGVTILTENLGKRFNREWIFRKLTYTFESGNTYAITGPNGSGKSTLMQILWGQSLPTSGNITYRREDSTIAETEIFRHISIATPYMDLVDEFTLDEQIDFHCSMKPLQEGLTKEELIDLLYLRPSRHKAIGVFSSGMRQRLKIGLALYTQADIIFLDEPGTNLDKQAFSWYSALMASIAPRALIIIASNNPEEYATATAVIDVMTFK